MAHAKEASLVRRGEISYWEAAQRVFRRREAFAMARPFSVQILNFGSTFVYRQGVLCYRSGSSLRILNIHNSAQLEQVINLPALISDEVEGDLQGCQGALKLLSYNDGVLICLYLAGKPVEVAYILAVRIFTSSHPSARYLFAHPLGSYRGIFARSNDSFICYGICDGLESGVPLWSIICFRLDTDPVNASKVVLRGVAGTDVGVTVCFEIHQGYFYAASTQPSPSLIFHNWDSYYHCCRIPLDDPRQHRLEHRHIWRRNHIDGPINDLWSNLRLHVDESTGALTIIEIRREWQFGASISKRTYFIQPINFADGCLSFAARGDASRRPISSSDTKNPQVCELCAATSPVGYASYISMGIRQSSRIPDYRPPRHIHASDDTLSSIHRWELFQVKLQYYDPSSSAFLDLICDQQEGADSGETRRIRILVGSRKLAPPSVNAQGLLTQPELDEGTGRIKPGSEESWIRSGSWLWPPRGSVSSPAATNSDSLAATSSPNLGELGKLHQILNYVPANVGYLGKRSGNESIDDLVPEAVADERSVVYSSGPAASGRQAIILINFDPAIRLESPQPFSSGENIGEAAKDTGRASGRDSSKQAGKRPTEIGSYDIRTSKDDGNDQDIGTSKDDNGNGAVKDTRDIGKEGMNTKRWFWTEKAQYLSINMSMRLRK